MQRTTVCHVLMQLARLQVELVQEGRFLSACSRNHTPPYCQSNLETGQLQTAGQSCARAHREWVSWAKDSYAPEQEDSCCHHCSGCGNDALLIARR